MYHIRGLTIGYSTRTKSLGSSLETLLRLSNPSTYTVEEAPVRYYNPGEACVQKTSAGTRQPGTRYTAY